MILIKENEWIKAMLKSLRSYMYNDKSIANEIMMIV